MGIRSFINRVGHSVNRGFNTFKTGAQIILPGIKHVSGMIHSASKHFSTLPVVGSAISQIGAVANVVNKGAHLAEQGINKAEQWQQGMGWG